MGKVKYEDFVQTLKDTSVDTDHKDEQDNNIYMTGSLKEVINFDDFLQAYFKDGNTKARKTNSVDAYCLLDGSPCLIEFKNNAILIVVYNREKAFKKEPDNDLGETQYLKPKEVIISPSLDAIRTHVGRKQEEGIVLFKLDTYKGKYFAKVMTMDKSIFNKYIEEHTIALPISPIR